MGHKSGRHKNTAKNLTAVPPATVKGNEQASPRTDTAHPNTNSEVPPVAHQEDRAATGKNTHLVNGQNREQNARVADGVTLPAADKGEETPKAAEHPKNTSNGQSPAKPAARDQKRRHDCCTLIANIVIALAAVAAVIVAALQWNAMRSQLDAMNKQTKSMSDQLEQMKADSESGSAAMSNQLDIMTKQWSVMGEQLAQMKADSLLDSRAWVGFDVGTVKKPTKSDEPLECSVTLINTGKTPAFNLTVSSGLDLKAPDWDIQAVATRSENRPDPNGSHSPLSPNARFRMSPPTKIMSEQMIADVASGKLVLYVFGIVRYDDHLGGHHITRYCHTVDAKTYQLHVYHQYNYMD
jgi:hypothetical protein